MFLRRCFWLGAVGPIVCFTQASSTLADRARGESRHATVLRLAHSNDGLIFRESPRVFAQGASNPSLVQVRDGRLVAVFDVDAKGPSGDQRVAVVTESRDDGRTWSPWKPIELRDADGGRIRLSDAELVVMPNGEARLFFCREDRKPKVEADASARHRYRLDAAVTRNASRFELDRRASIELERRPNGAPVGFLKERQLHVVLQAGRATVEPESNSSIVHFVARDGRGLVRAAPPQSSGVEWEGSVVQLDKGHRLYFSSKGRVMSAISTDGVRWPIENGVRIANAADPAVVRMDDGSYLALFEADPEHLPAGGSPFVAPTADVAELLDRIRLDEPNVAFGDSGATMLDVAHPGASPTDGGQVPPNGSLSDWPVDAIDETVSSVELLTHGASDGYGFAPAPNFNEKFDYFAWYRDAVQDKSPDNAFPLYAAFMGGVGETEPEWPQASGMFTDADYNDPPGPWDPAEHAEWAASDEAFADLMAKYREATLYEGYASPPQPDPGPADPDPLLVEMLLPNLHRHRQMAKVTLENAWRMKDGAVDAKRLIESWETVLRNANQLARGGTLIERLVSVAERGLVHKNALWALKHDVLGESELQTAIDSFQRLNQPASDPATWVRGEHAFAMDSVQYLFEPQNPGDPPRLDLDRARYLSGMAGGGDEDRERRLSEMQPEDATKSIEAFDSYYRDLTDQMRLGYPLVRAADLEATAERYVHTNPLTETLLPALSRVFQLHTRNDASRRATQLAFATHLFKARNGRWPNSLDELPPEHAANARSDPFSGVDFGYRVDPDGPVIYSASENGLDDGGVHSPRWNDVIKNDAGSDDFVFYPPQN